MNDGESHLLFSTLSASPDGSSERRAEETLRRTAVKAGAEGVDLLLEVHITLHPPPSPQEDEEEAALDFTHRTSD